MGKPKTQRTEALKQAIDRHRLAEQADNAIEQHNFDKLVRQGFLKTLGSIALEGLKQRGLSTKVPKPPKGRGRL